jgi:hypothetical protein
MNLDISHWKNFSGFGSKKLVPIKDILIDNSFIQSSNLKIRLLNNEMLKYECNICFISE